MNTRGKGTRYEREVADVFTAAGFTVRGLENAGDHLIISRKGLVLHGECKRQERLRLPEWLAQLKRDAPQGTVPVLTFRQSRGESWSVIRAADLAALLGGVSNGN